MSSLNLPISISASWFYIVVMNFSDAARICNPLFYGTQTTTFNVCSTQRTAG